MLNPQRRDLNVGILETETVTLDPNTAMLNTISNLKSDIERLLNENYIKQLVRVVIDETANDSGSNAIVNVSDQNTARSPTVRATNTSLFTIPKVTSIDVLWSLWCGSHHPSLAPLKDGIGILKPTVTERSNYSKRKTICKAIESTPGATDDEKLETFKLKYPNLYGPTSKNGLKQKEILIILQREDAAEAVISLVGEENGNSVVAEVVRETRAIVPRYPTANHRRPTRRPRRQRSNSRPPFPRSRRIRLTWNGEQMSEMYLNQFDTQ